jgi:hypothetical protein
LVGTQKSGQAIRRHGHGGAGPRAKASKKSAPDAGTSSSLRPRTRAPDGSATTRTPPACHPLGTRHASHGRSPGRPPQKARRIVNITRRADVHCRAAGSLTLITVSATFTPRPFRMRTDCRYRGRLSPARGTRDVRRPRA